MSKILATTCMALLLAGMIFSYSDMVNANDKILANSKTLPDNLDLSEEPKDFNFDTSAIWARAEAENWKVNSWNDYYLRCLWGEMRSRIENSSKDFKNSKNYEIFDWLPEGSNIRFILNAQDLIVTTTLPSGRYTDQLYCRYDLKNNTLINCIQCEVNWLFCDSIESSTGRYVYHCYLQSDGKCVGELIDLQTMKFVTPKEIPCLGGDLSDVSIEDIEDKLLIQSLDQEWSYKFDKEQKLFVLVKK